MARGRSDGNGLGIRGSIDVRKDPVAFRASWPMLSDAERLGYTWPEDLSYTDLSDLNLSGCDLTHRNFTGSDLRGADFRGALLDGAIFYHVKLQEAKFDDEIAGSPDVGFDMDPEEIIFLLEPDHEDSYEGSLDNLVRKYKYRDGSIRVDNYYGKEAFKPKSSVYHSADTPEGQESINRDPKDGPAVRIWNGSGVLTRQDHMVHGSWHNPYGPAIEKWHDAGQKMHEMYIIDNNKHNSAGPADIQWDADGTMRVEAYYTEGELDNKNGPALRTWFEDGEPEVEEYWVGGKEHNLTAPARRVWHDNGQLRVEAWWKDGKKHRPKRKGPAYIEYNREGEIIKEEYWEKGVEYTKLGKKKVMKDSMAVYMNRIVGYDASAPSYYRQQLNKLSDKDSDVTPEEILKKAKDMQKRSKAQAERIKNQKKRK